MQKNPLSLLLSILLISSLSICTSVNAQSPIEGPSWSIGWATDMDSTYLVEMDIDWDAEGEITVYVENNRMAQLELALEYEFSSWVPFTFDGPESFSVAANANETFTIDFGPIDDDETREYNPDNTSTLTVTAEEKVGDTTASTQELEGDVSVPKIFDLRPKVTLPEENLFAGSWIDISVQIVNGGNFKDAIKEASVQFRSCPHLSMPGVEDISDTLVDPTDVQNGKDTFLTLRLEASSSQPSRVCEVTLALQSEGDDATRSSSFELEVKAVEQQDEPTTDDDATQDSDMSLTEESNSVPWLGSVELLALIGFVMICRRGDLISSNDD